ncbi:DNA polymerase III subunit gamma/tau [Candidatus Nomurabacteria bacterium]|uniref:DNA polymerase III subunit gamma/tau n=1 Tax=candidate division WWE3 bacterium TaxID=2053526 RepID=A0A955IVS8_UNCKA|nr:DNA polymerase III subunit gamma/tau [candidate division WWE3 bacterium]MCB9823665.1 DNA polymerase III subunit gamma/tau [Candidatus Nomurabacteria bacterium]MCB9827257.1 DNA polymerase III subunit gamma/tau [Candidatus Nomurabacteria bacterium]MCB9827460.1 DNA polymerase III subunit gamma/tau [Candidatus Nomurabacteria bacterium]
MYYTKYRPQKFSEIIKPNLAAEVLMKQAVEGKIGHAYLFIGSRGTGKTTTARILAKAINCLNLEKNGDPCNKCKNCVSIAKGAFMDLIEIDAASNRGIDDIRTLRDMVNLAPTSGKGKVYIIDEVHMLTNEAFNALLKTLEEPPARVTFILCTTEAHKVPDTVRSRCQVLKFKRATIEQIVEKLENILKEEVNKDLSKQDLTKIAQAAFGGFRDAETLLQQVIEGSMEISSFVGLNSSQTIVDFIENLISKDSSSALLLLNKLVDEGLDINVWLMDVLSYLRDMLFIKQGIDSALVDMPAETMKEIIQQAKKISSAELVFYIESLLESQIKMTRSFIAHLPLEIAVVKICSKSFDSESVSRNAHDLPSVPPEVLRTAKNTKNESIKTATRGNRKEAPGVSSSLVERSGAVSVLAAQPDVPESVIPEIEALINEEDCVIALEEIQQTWNELLKNISTINSSISALLKNARPTKVVGAKVVIQVAFSFHKERLEAQKNRQIVERALLSLMNRPLTYECHVGGERPVRKNKGETGDLTDKNISAPIFSGTSEELKNNILEVFDGGLPL